MNYLMIKKKKNNPRNFTPYPHRRGSMCTPSLSSLNYYCLMKNWQMGKIDYIKVDRK